MTVRYRLLNLPDLPAPTLVPTIGKVTQAGSNFNPELSQLNQDFHPGINSV